MMLISVALVTAVGIIHHQIWFNDYMSQCHIILEPQKPLETKRFYISNLSPKRLKSLPFGSIIQQKKIILVNIDRI